MLWQRDDEFIIYLNGVLNQSGRLVDALETRAYLAVEGRCTSNALKVAVEELKSISATLMKSMYLIEEKETVKWLNQYIDSQLQSDSLQSPPETREFDVKTLLPFIKECLN